MPGKLSSNDQKTLRIYALLEPDGQTARYVGQTADYLNKRLDDHLRRPGKTRKGAWIQSLLNAGEQPQIVLLETFTGWRRQAYERETHWIKKLRTEGHPLLNVP